MRRAHEPTPEEESTSVPARPIVAQPTAAQPTAAEQIAETSGGSPTTQRLLMLQRTAGNRAVSALLDDPQSDDPQSSVAGQVDALVGQRRGQSLDPAVRTDMESRLGAGFSGVRVHRGRQAEETAAAVGARAFTVGEDVVFGAGAYDPVGTRGRQTIAHELTHVMQQRRGGVDGRVAAEGLQVSDPHDRFEQEATKVAAAAVEPGSEPVAVSGGPAALHAPSEVVVQRIPLVPDPTTTLDPDKQQILEKATETLPIWAQSFAGVWFDAAEGALSADTDPEDARARQNWWVALIGNMTWAATSLLNPGLTAVVMSFGGAAAGSGAAAQDLAPSGKNAVLDHVAETRDAMVAEASRTTVPEVAAACAQDKMTDPELQRQRLWRAMIPNKAIGYNKLADLVTVMHDRIKYGLLQFNEQYQAWRDAPYTQEGMTEHLKNRSEAQKRSGDVIPWQVRSEWEKTHPFHPNLNFLEK